MRQTGNSTVNGAWRPTSFTAGNPNPATGVTWGTSRPWAILYPGQFQVPPPPALSSDEYRASYDEVKSIGGAVSTTRTPAQNVTANWWRGNPEYYWNQVRKAGEQGSQTVTRCFFFDPFSHYVT